MDKSPKNVPKKPYSPPHLIVHGTVRELTQKVGPARTLDAGKFPHNRTSLH
jgi:hypothetical protein